MPQTVYAGCRLRAYSHINHPRVRPHRGPNRGANAHWVAHPVSIGNDESALCGASPEGPGRQAAHGVVAVLAQAASLGCGPRLALHPLPPRRGGD
jgi:hypothetical protein